MPTPDRLHPAPFIAGATTVTLIGVWLVVAPFAVGYQPEGAEWADATIIGVVSGGAVTLLGLLALLVAFGALRGEVRRRGLAPSIRPEPAQRDRESGHRRRAAGFTRATWTRSCRRSPQPSWMTCAMDRPTRTRAPPQPPTRPPHQPPTAGSPDREDPPCSPACAPPSSC